MKKLIVIAFLVGCGSSPESDRSSSTPAPDLKAAAQKVVNDNCVMCHQPPNPRHHVDLTDLGAVAGTDLVVKGDASASKLYTIILQGKMPPRKHLSEEEIAPIKDWINSL